jgi:hypothetical protein
VLDRHRWVTRDELRLAIITWIEAIYHRRRRQRRLGRLTPIVYETLTRADQAADHHTRRVNRGWGSPVFRPLHPYLHRRDQRLVVDLSSAPATKPLRDALTELAAGCAVSARALVGSSRKRRLVRHR